MWKSILWTCRIPHFHYGHLWIILLLLDPVTRINALPTKKYATQYSKRKPPLQYYSSPSEFSGLPYSDSFHSTSYETDDQLFTQGTFHVPPEAVIPFVSSDALVEGKWSQPAVETPPSNFHPVPSALLPSTSSSISDHNAPPFQHLIPSQSFVASEVNSEQWSPPPSPLAFVNPSHFTTPPGYMSKVETTHVQEDAKWLSVTEQAVTSDSEISGSKVSSSSNYGNKQHAAASVKQPRTVADANADGNNLNVGESHSIHETSSILFNTSKVEVEVDNTSDLPQHSEHNNSYSAHKASDIVNASTSQNTSDVTGVTHSVQSELQTLGSKADDEEFSTHPMTSVAHPLQEVSEESSQVVTVSSASDTASSEVTSTNYLQSVPTSLPSLPKVEGTGDALHSVGNDSKPSSLASGAVAGIVIAVLICATLLTSTVIYCLYRWYNGKCTSAVESKFNSDNCGYLDDSLRSSVYLNNHIELPKESSEEMTSLDNDSFLNSLETMTIQNYWADNTKNTKV